MAEERAIVEEGKQEKESYYTGEERKVPKFYRSTLRPATTMRGFRRVKPAMRTHRVVKKRPTREFEAWVARTTENMSIAEGAKFETVVEKFDSLEEVLKEDPPRWLPKYLRECWAVARQYQNRTMPAIDWQQLLHEAMSKNKLDYNVRAVAPIIDRMMPSDAKVPPLYEEKIIDILKPHLLSLPEIQKRKDRRLEFALYDFNSSLGTALSHWRCVHELLELRKLEKLRQQRRRRSKIPPKGALFLPVVRYQSLYYGSEYGIQKEELSVNPETQLPYCGRFYYIEPGSTTVLNLGRAAVFASKVHAVHVLLDELVATDPEYVKSIVESELAWPMTDDLDVVHLLRARLLLDVTLWKNVHAARERMLLESGEWEAERLKPLAEQHAELWSEMEAVYERLYLSGEEWRSERIPGADQLHGLMPCSSGKWKEHLEIGEHDFLDQLLCKIAARVGLDTVVLQHEIGERRAVSEILDVRPDSYRHLHEAKLPPGQDSWWEPQLSTECPTIWFPTDGMFRNVAPSPKKGERLRLGIPDLQLQKVQIELKQNRAFTSPL